MELSDNAKKLLKYFQDRNLREMDYEYPSAMEKLFEYDLETCAIAVAAHPGNWGTRNFSGPRFRTVMPFVLYEIVIPFNGNGIS